MPRIEHLALWADDVERLTDFYCTHFGARREAAYDNPAKGFASRFVAFDGGARLEIMRTATLAPARHAPGAQRMGLTHVAISVGSQAEVDALTRRLRELGHAVVDGPRRTGDGYYESVVLDPEGNRVEITI